MSRLDSALRRLVAVLPWYDPDQVERRHARTERVRRHSIDARLGAEAIPQVRRMIQERQDRQEVRLRALDLQAALSARRRR